MSEARNMRKVLPTPPSCLHPVEGIEIVKEDTEVLGGYRDGGMRGIPQYQTTHYRGTQEALIEAGIVPAEAFTLGREHLTLWLEYPGGHVVGRTYVQRRRGFYHVKRAHPPGEPPYMPLPQQNPFAGLDFSVSWPSNPLPA